jgi:pimeloyl-ACP methyl ester carboxylesterase
VQTGQVRLHYHRTGGSRPPVVLAHGITDNGLCWSRLARSLEAEYDLIMYDARGHGASDKPDGGYAYAQLAEDLAGLIRELDLGRPAVIGHSMGARTAAEAGAAHPDLIGRLVLEDPPWYVPEERDTPERTAARAAAWRREHEERCADGRDQVRSYIRRVSPDWHDADVEPWIESQFQLDARVFDVVAESPAQWEQVAPRLKCPTLLVTGAPELGALVTAAVADQLASLCPDCRVASIAGAGHCIRRDRFDQYAEAVRAFLGETT